MGLSIQDNLKKINSRITRADCISLLVTTLFLLSFLSYLTFEATGASSPLSYITGSETDSTALTPVKASDSRAFGSRKGKTYTFSWCQGANNIAMKNKVFFGSEEEARKTGRTLSKLCQK